MNCLKKYLILFSFIISITSANSQTCTAYAPSNIAESNTITIPEGQTMCFDQDLTFGYIRMENNSNMVILDNANVKAQYQNSILNDNTQIIVNKGSTFTLSLDIDKGSTLGYKNNFTVLGDLIFLYPITFYGDTVIEVGETGRLLIGTDGARELYFQSKNYSKVDNDGKILLNSIEFLDDLDFDVEYTLTNNNSIDFRNFGSTGDAIVHINNEAKGIMNFNGGYTSNNAILSNCGTINFYGPVNLNGGLIVNSGLFNFNIISFDFGSGTNIFKNFGILNFQPENSIYLNMGASDIFENHGLMDFDNTYFASGNFLGPDENNRKGYIELETKGNKHSLTSIQGNLDIKNIDGPSTVSDLFWSPPNIGPGVTFDCRSSDTCSAPLITTGSNCPDDNGEVTDAIIHINPQTTIK